MDGLWRRSHPSCTHTGDSKVAKTAQKEGITLKQAAVNLGILTADQFDQYVRPADMCQPNRDDA